MLVCCKFITIKSCYHVLDPQSIITLNVIQLVKIYHANCNHIPFTTLGNKLINAMEDFSLKCVSLSSFHLKVPYIHNNTPFKI